MTKSDKYNELRSRINKHCPELLELKYGCEIHTKQPVNAYSEEIDGTKEETRFFVVKVYGGEMCSDNGEIMPTHVFAETYFKDFATTLEFADADWGDDSQNPVIVGSPPQLQHVLRAIHNSSNWTADGEHELYYGFDASGFFIVKEDDEQLWRDCHSPYYNLSLPLSAQEESVLDFLLDVIE